jgi:hypothetical protein
VVSCSASRFAGRQPQVTHAAELSASRSRFGLGWLGLGSREPTVQAAQATTPLLFEGVEPPFIVGELIAVVCVELVDQRSFRHVAGLCS